MAADDLGEVLFEIRAFGMSARVAAVHVETNTEVVVVCPATYTEFSMRQAALRKLRTVVAKKRRDEPPKGRWHGL